MKKLTGQALVILLISSAPFVRNAHAQTEIVITVENIALFTQVRAGNRVVCHKGAETQFGIIKGKKPLDVVAGKVVKIIARIKRSIKRLRRRIGRLRERGASRRRISKLKVRIRIFRRGVIANCPLSPVNFQIGTNLEWLNSYAAQLIFVDVFKRSRPWIPNNYPQDDSWDSGVAIPMDADGYPLQIPYSPPRGGPDQIVTTLMYDTLKLGEYPAGNYTLIFDGMGTIHISGTVTGGETLVFNNGGTHSVTITPGISDGEVLLEIIASQLGNHIRNIRFIMPGYEDVYQTQPFYPPFIERLSKFAVVRLAQTMRANDGDYPCDNAAEVHEGGCVKLWGSRTKMNGQTQGGNRGVALEYLIDLMNTANVSPWFTIPHGADDTYIREFAKIVRDRLKPTLKAYIEWSNEIWNFAPGFWPQHNYAPEKGLSMGLGGGVIQTTREMSIQHTSRQISFVSLKRNLGDQLIELLKCCLVFSLFHG